MSAVECVLTAESRETEGSPTLFPVVHSLGKKMEIWEIKEKTGKNTGKLGKNISHFYFGNPSAADECLLHFLGALFLRIHNDTIQT